MPEVVDDSVFIADNTVELSQLNEISAIVPNSKGMSSSQWKITPLKGTDVEESVDENGIGNRRRDSVDNLFEIVPNCSIAGSGEDGGGDFCGRGPGRVLSTTGGSDALGIVLDTELLILEKESTLPPRRIEFGARIDFILWRRSIILAGLASSEIVLVDPNTFVVKESKKVDSTLKQDCDRFFVDAAIHSNPDPSKIDVVAVGRNGVVYSFHNISLCDGTLDSTHDQNMSVDIDVGSIRGTRIKCLTDKENPQVLCCSSPSRSILILCEQGGTLSFHDIQDLAGFRKELKANQCIDIMQDLGLNAKTITVKKLVSFEGLLFILLSNGNLEIFLDDLLFATESLQLPDHAFVVHDFALMLNGEGEVKLWVLYGLKDFSRNYIGIFGGCSFTPEFCAKIPALAIQMKDKVVSGLLFPSQATPLEEPFGFLEVSNLGVTVYRMLETSTDTTIQKLLARGKFNQAAEMAAHYGKDLDVVYKAKTRAKFNELLGIGDVGKAGPVFEELVESLEKVRDATFVCDFCAQKGFASLAWIRRLLNVGKGRVMECKTTPAGTNLLLTVKKLFTFEQVFPNAAIQEWLEFVSIENTMFQQCKWFINKHEFAKCEKVWRRHFDEFIPTIKLDDFGPFFFIMFSQKLSSPSAVSLFKCILPFAVEKCAERQIVPATDSSNLIFSPVSSSNFGLDAFQLAKVEQLVNIAKRQVCSFERERLWPTEAIQFSKIVISIVKEAMENLSGGSRIDTKTKTQILICADILSRMEIIVQNLVELSDLRKNHSIRIPFQQYMEDDVIEVVNSMLCELFHRPEIETFIAKFLTPFAARKHIHVDDLYYKHIEAVVSDLPFHINPIDIPQEERLICLISHISETESKLKSVLKIAEEWPVPWTQNIDNLVVECLKIGVRGDEVCSQIQNTINIMRVQVPFRCLLNKHRLTATKVQNYCGVVMALTRIINNGKPDYYSDCMEFIKHTGFVDEDKVKSIGFGLKLRNGAPVETLVDPTWDRKLLKRLLARTLQEFRMGSLEIFHEEELRRIVDVGKILANILEDRRALEFFKLREFIPTLNNPDIAYEDSYPFCVLNHVMPIYYNKPTQELIHLCTQLSDITFSHLPDVLSTAAAFYTRPGATPSELKKLWEIVEKIVSMPGCVLSKNSEVVHSSAVTIAQFLICQCPESSDENLAILQDFLVILTEYEKSIEEVTKMLTNLKIFLTLREQEIPLEKEFLQMYEWLFLKGIPSEETLLQALKGMGSIILKFGDTNLFKQVFGCVVKEFHSRMGTNPENMRASIKRVLKNVQDLQSSLYRSLDRLTEPENNREVIHLVACLNKEVDMTLTPYALRQRNKTRFLNKLLNRNKFSLAAQIAIVFEVFSDSESWSRILKGFMTDGDVKELRKVLLDLRNVSELWILPEFAEGWKMVADKDSSFLDLCPIPLD